MKITFNDSDCYRMSSVIAYGKQFFVQWQEMGNMRRLNVYLASGALLGFRDLPLPVDTGDGVVEYIVKSIFRGQSETKVVRA